MQLSLLGLGKMGYPLALNMRDKGHTVVGFDPNPETRLAIQRDGINTKESVADCIQSLEGRKIVWLMVPAGKIVDQILEEVLLLLSKGDVIVDGGNSNYKESQARSEKALAHGIDYLDCGTSGGTSGARHGICAMVGGRREAFAYIEPIVRSISLPNGYLYCGPSGSGHFTKMVHNGIEYGMMQSIAEGFSHLRASGMDLNLADIAQLWNQGSVVRGWLMELTESALRKDPGLDSIRGIAHASGEAQWMVEDAMDRKVSIPVIALSLLMRFQSQDAENFPAKVVAALRNEFGGHAVEKKA
ncbi:MAG: decarboxylating 6-phosphogluconate dehydrogenase [Chitinophagaceae bacterium]|nr:decarboxylating 6-phosphogluconate dehydrogenase [Chitinophagaceae bacterium]